MWAVEAKKFGDNPDYFYISGLTETESKRMHKQMANSGEWEFVRSWDKVAEWEQEKANKRIRNWKKDN
jgi:hypothetical protein